MKYMQQSTQHFENRDSPSGLVSQEMKWSIKFWDSLYGLDKKKRQISNILFQVSKSPHIDKKKEERNTPTHLLSPSCQS